jgi:glycosyltransferase involved in cell wall biosynthesis
LREFAQNSKPFLLSVGLLEDEYDLFMQIDAMEKVLKQFPHAGLMIVGSGSLDAELRSFIASKPYADKIMMTGDLEHKITLHMINDCDILLRTTLFDGDAISVREAVFLDTPVIATDNGMRPPGVHLIPVHDIDALESKMNELAIQKKGEKVRNTDDNSNITAVLKLYDSLYNEDNQ